MKTTNQKKPAVLKTCTAAVNAAEAHAQESAAWARKAKICAEEAAFSAERARRWFIQTERSLSYLKLQNKLLVLLSVIFAGVLVYLVIFK